MKNNTKEYYTPKQDRLPPLFSDILDVCDPVVTFDRIMEEIGIEKYLKPKPPCHRGRPGYDRVRMLKTVLFGFMDTGYASLRELEDRCRVNIRYRYLMDQEVPGYRTFGYFINDELKDSAEDIFKAVMEQICEKEGVDLRHLYIDGSKFEANANKYTWVWKKSTEKSRYRLFQKITALIEEINRSLSDTGFQIETNVEYTPQALEMILLGYAHTARIDEETFVRGRGHRKSREQKYYEKLKGYMEKLWEYVKKLWICGPERNSYSKTDHGATFMRIKKDHMGNGQLLPAYNVQMGIADEYIAVVDVRQYRSDMDCFIPLMEKFHELYGFYPEYPVADAGYGSFNNYLYCEDHGMEKYMKFPMYRKETKDEAYHKDPFRAVNFRTGEDGSLICPNGKKLRFAYRKEIQGNLYGRQEEYYTCEDCSGCPYTEKCKKTEKNRTVCLNRELSAMHEEVLANLESIQGALLRMNRSIQAEGTFGIVKYDRWYKRTVRKGLGNVKLELYLVSIGHNLYKYRNKQIRQQKAA